MFRKGAFPFVDEKQTNKQKKSLSISKLVNVFRRVSYLLNSFKSLKIPESCPDSDYRLVYFSETFCSLRSGGERLLHECVVFSAVVRASTSAEREEMLPS